MSTSLEQFFETSGKTQSELGKHCGVSQATVSRWLSSGRIPEDQLAPVAKFTGLPAAALRPDLAELFRESA